MEVELTGTNRKLLHQHAFLIYKANRAADRNRWVAFQKYSALAEKRLRKIARSLGIDTRKYIVAPNTTHSGLVLIDRKEKEA